MLPIQRQILCPCAALQGLVRPAGGNVLRGPVLQYLMADIKWRFNVCACVYMCVLVCVCVCVCVIGGQSFKSVCVWKAVI